MPSFQRSLLDSARPNSLLQMGRWRFGDAESDAGRIKNFRTSSCRTYGDASVRASLYHQVSFGEYPLCSCNRNQCYHSNVWVVLGYHWCAACMSCMDGVVDPPASARISFSLQRRCSCCHRSPVPMAVLAGICHVGSICMGHHCLPCMHLTSLSSRD